MAHGLTLDRENAAVRLADLADHSRSLGHHSRANRFLLLAWAAYDTPDDQPVTGRELGQLLGEAPVPQQTLRDTAQIFQFSQAAALREAKNH